MTGPHWRVSIVVLTGCAAPPSTNDGSVTGDGASFTMGVSTLAGAAEVGDADGDRVTARFSDPVNVAYGPDGKVYVADFTNNKLRVVDADGTTATALAVHGFQRPFGLAFAANGTLYVSTDDDPAGVHDDMSGTIWRVDIAARTATPVAARVGRPRSLAVLADGRIVAADDLHHVVQLVDPTTGATTVLAGAWGVKGFHDGVGALSRFSTPYGIAVRADGMLVVCDFDNNRVRLVGLDGVVSTLAGTGVAGFADGALASAQFHHPQAVAIAGDAIYITDIDNFRVRAIRTTEIVTVAGSGVPGYVDADDRLQAELYGLEGLAVTPDGSMLYVADGSRGEPVPYNRVRQIKM